MNIAGTKKVNTSRIGRGKICMGYDMISLPPYVNILRISRRSIVQKVVVAPMMKRLPKKITWLRDSMGIYMIFQNVHWMDNCLMPKMKMIRPSMILPIRSRTKREPSTCSVIFTGRSSNWSNCPFLTNGPNAS